MSLNIEIPTSTATYRLTSDSYGFIVERKHLVDPTKAPNWEQRKAEGADPTPRETWADPKYHGRLEQAVESLIQRKARESDAETLSELLAELRQFSREIKALLTF